MSNTQVTVVQPGDLDVRYFGIDMSSGVPKVVALSVSKDTGNLIVEGGDHKAFISAAVIQGAQKTYRLALEGQKFNHYVTDASTGVTTLQDSLDSDQVDATISGATFTNGQLRLTQTDGKPDVIVDLSRALQTIATSPSYSASLAGDGTAGSPLIPSVIIDPVAGNVLKVSMSGVRVATADIISILNANITHTIGIDTGAQLFKSKVGPVEVTLNLVRMLDLAGNTIGYSYTGT